MKPVDAEMLVRCAQCCIDAKRHMARSLPGSVIEEGDGFTRIASGLQEAHFNPLFLTSPSVDAAALLASSRAFYGHLGLPFRVTALGFAVPAATEALRSQLGEGVDYPGMLLTSLEGDIGEAPGLRVQKVETLEALEMFHTITAEAFGEAREDVRPFDTDAVLKHPACTRYLGFVDGEPAATSMRCVGRGVAMVLNIVTRRHFERRGVGAVMTRSAALPAREEGCDVSFLQATAAGRRLYERLGYESIMNIRTWWVNEA